MSMRVTILQKKLRAIAAEGCVQLWVALSIVLLPHSTANRGTIGQVPHGVTIDNSSGKVVALPAPQVPVAA